MDEKLFPQDLVSFLKSGEQLSYDTDECEPGQISLLSFDELSLGEVYIDSEESPLAKKDPHAGEEGYYSVPAINLVADCDGYDPEGILIWLPDQKVFGTWDIDHWDVLIFPDVTWSDIVSDPAKYINAQWERDDVKCEYFQPFPKYPFKTGKPFNNQ
ncbi:MAG: hypothetical protein HZB50_06840 [Chloroflexi bacterium]|nr:hypothetical protein [Chloroflexota bacterium]